MMNKISNCNECNLCINQKPLMDRLRKCDVMWVGLSAKRVKDVNVNYPLENNTNSGMLIEEIERKNPNIKYYKTNLVKCLPLGEDDKIRYPTREEMSVCIKNLFMEIEIVKPRTIFLLGDIVYKFVNNYMKKNNIIINANIVKIEHPSYICVYKRTQKGKYIAKVTDEIERGIDDGR